MDDVFDDPGDLGFLLLEDDEPHEPDDLDNPFYEPAPGEDLD
jgi:hypothetical protein